jgi:hypothetical protein
MSLVITNPYFKDQRHVIQTYVSEEDWITFQTATGISRGLAANLLALYFKKTVTKLKEKNATRNDQTTAEVLQQLLS